MHKEFGIYKTEGLVNLENLRRLIPAKNTKNDDPVLLDFCLITNRFVQLNILPDFYMCAHQLNHPNLLRVLDIFEFERNQKRYLIFVQEYIRFEFIQDYISKADNETHKYYLGQMISALSYMHSQQYAHENLDLKCLLIDEQLNLKICLFALTQNEYTGQIETRIGTPSYMPPELFETDRFAYDMFCMGVISFKIYFGIHPFTLTTDSYYDLFCTNNTKFWIIYESYSKKQIPLDFIVLMNGLFEKNPKKRFTADQVLQQQWMAGNIVLIKHDEFGQRSLESPQLNRKYYGQYLRIHELQSDLELAIDTTNNSYVKIHILQTRQNIQEQKYFSNKMRKQQHQHKCQFYSCIQFVHSKREPFLFGMLSEFCCGFSLSNYIQYTSAFNSRVCRYLFGQLYELIFYLNQKNVFSLNINHNSIIINQDLQIKVDYFAQQKTQSTLAKQDIQQLEYLESDDIYEAGLVLFYMYFGQLPFNQTSNIDQKYMCFRNDRKQFWEQNKATLKNKQEPLLDDLTILIEGMIEPNINFRSSLKDIESNKWFQQQKVELNYVQKVFFKRNKQLMEIQEIKNLEQQLTMRRSCERLIKSQYNSYELDRIYYFADIEYLLDEKMKIQPYDYTMEIQYYTPFLIDFLIRYLLQYFKQIKMDIINIDETFKIELKFNECKFKLLFWQILIYNTGISFNLIDGNQQIFKSITENIIKQIQIA